MHISLKNLTEFDDSFQKEVRNWRNMPEVSEYFVLPYIEEETHSEWLASLKKQEENLAFVILKSGIPVGLTYFRKISKEQKSCDWGIFIHDLSVRGQGIGSHVLDILIEYAFSVLKLEKINLEVLENNDIAKNIYFKKGFILMEGDNREKIAHNQRIKALRMCLTKGNFDEKNNSI